jgi:hypothetical protein
VARILAVARVRHVLLAMGVVFAVLPVGSALADTTIGQTGTGLACQAVDPGGVFGDTGYVVPAGGGTITSFSIQVTRPNEQVDFLVLRPAGGGTYTVVGKTGVQTLTPTGVETFPASVPVQGGDILGFWFNGFLGDCGYSGSGANLVGLSGRDDPTTGDTFSLFASTSLTDLNESANLVKTLPTSKEQCTNGGWKSFGGQFKNQGDCVSFVATGGKNQPSGS